MIQYNMRLKDSWRRANPGPDLYSPIYSLFGDPGSGSWYLSDDAFVADPGINYFDRSFRYDFPMWQSKGMQDCIESKFHYSFNLPSFEGNWSYSGLLDRHIHFARTAYSVRGIPERVVASRIFTQDSLHFDPDKFGDRAQSIYYKMRQTQITRQVTLKVKDPFDTDFSLWYLLVDLHELPKLAKSLLSFVSRRAFRSSRPFREVANGFLSIKFGILPTIQDLKDFLDICLRWSKAYSLKQDAFNVVYTARAPKTEYGLMYDYGVPASLDLTDYLGVAPLPGVTRVQWNQFQLCQTTKFHFICPELTGVIARIKLAVDLLGIYDWGSALWDKIPFSFVLDWVYDITSWLHDNLKPRLFPVDLAIVDWGESLRRDGVISGSFPYLTSDPLGDGRQVVSSIEMTGTSYQYARVNQYPRPLGVIRNNIFKPNSILTLNHTFVGVALVGQRNSVRVIRKNTPSRYRRKKSVYVAFRNV